MFGRTLSLTGSFGWNAASGEVFWSEQSFSIFEYDANAKPSIDLMLQRVHPEDISPVQLAFSRATEHGTDFDIEFRLLMPGGAIKHIHAVAHVVTNVSGKDKGGRNRQFVGAVMDVTAARNSEEKLQQAQNEIAYIGRITSLGALSSSIAHEINQPLGAITANGEACLRWMARGAEGLGEATSAVKRMISDGNRASEIIERIRGLSRKSELKRTELDLNDVIREIVPLVQREVINHRASLQLDLAQQLPPALADRVQLQQVIINLILNSIQAMDGVTQAPRVVVIRSRQSTSNLTVVEIEDSGHGIKPEDTERIFDAFFTTKREGMGMGLSICRSIMEAHEGRIWAAANRSGPGMTVSFSLPSLGPGKS
jgi:C4-dicarboxylate-specific signal transduction histidine kinase